MTDVMQEARPARFVTPLGPNELVLTEFSASEGLSELFETKIEAFGENREIDFDDAIGQHCHIELTTPDDKRRIFNGILTECRRTGQSAQLTNYSLVLRPWLWLLAHRANCRIFLDKSVKDIIKEVFEDAGFGPGTDFDFRTQETYDPIPYCVQYRETDFTFISRLAEEFGIYYFFEHSTNAHTLILADGLGSHQNNPHVPNLPAEHGWRGGDKQYLRDWVAERRYSTGKYELNDYDYLKPAKKLIATKTATERYNRAKFEVYDYPGRYDETPRGEKFAQFRLEAEQAFDKRRYSDGIAPSLFPGSLVTVEKHPTASENALYLILRCHHNFANETYRSGSAAAASASGYRGNFEFLASDRPFRAYPTTPKPRIPGVQTARVVGKKGEENREISTDEHGHIFVNFHWDRAKKISCPVRVAQAWAGNRWGEIFIPRIGMEVVIEYLEGDPDRPLVVGCVYNGANKVPYDLPANKTRAGWKSDSTEGHGGYNEIYFEDKKSSEVINVHAQKDLNVTVLNNETRSVGANMTTTIGNSETHTVGKGFKTPTGSSSRKTIIKHGDDQLDVETGAILHTAKVKIVLTVGPSKITIDPTGITLDAPTITIKAATLCTIQGLPVKIN